MDGRRFFYLLVAAGVAYYLYSHSASQVKARSSSTSSSSGSSSSGGGFDCLQKADQANSALQNASSLLMKLPVDQSAWSSAESSASSAISSAESACGGGTTDAERSGMSEVTAALGLMRTSLGEFSSAARGGGGAMNAAGRQGEIDSHLDRARSLLK